MDAGHIPSSQVDKEREEAVHSVGSDVKVVAGI